MHSSPESEARIQRAVDGLRELILAVDQYRQLLAGRDGLTLSQMSALSYLRSRGDLGQTALARALGLTTGSITALLDRMEAAGWVDRLPHPGDRRRTMVRVTAQGREYLQRIRGEFGRSLSTVRPEDLDVVTEALSSIARQLATDAADS